MNAFWYFLGSLIIAFTITTLGVEHYGLQYTSIAVFLLFYSAYLGGFGFKYLERKKIKETNNQQLELWLDRVERDVPKVKQVNRMLLNPIHSHEKSFLLERRTQYISNILRFTMANYHTK